MRNLMKFVCTGFTEREAFRSDANHRLTRAGEHIPADDLKRSDSVFFINSFCFFFSFALKLIFDLLLGSCQVTGNLRDTVVVYKTADFPTGFGKISGKRS